MKLFILLLWGCTLGAARAQTTALPPARELVEEGVQLYDDGKYAEAVAKYQQALKAEPGHVTATSELALTYHAMGHYAEAADLCEKLLKDHPDADAGSVFFRFD